MVKERKFILVVREGIDENAHSHPLFGERESRISPEEKIVSTVGLRYDNDEKRQCYAEGVKFAEERLKDEQIALAVRVLLPEVRKAADDIENGLDRYNLHELSLREFPEDDN